MLRRLWLLCALALFLSPLAHGVGLGSLELESALNQEFDAEIELTNIRGLEPEEIRPGLASQEDFARVGIERSYQLTDLRFDVVTNDDGNLAIHVTSTRPIVEPYLNFLVEVLWPNGRILREYTVLLDPPIFGQGGVERINAPSMSQPSTAQPATTPPSRPSRTETSQADRTAGSDQASARQRTASMDEYGMTGPGDTLWAIALETRPDQSISVQQMMLALKRANPEAFINDNINLLKAGYVLRIPDADEVNRETFESAVARVEQENEAFQSYRGGSNTTTAQRDASPRRTASGSTSGSASQGELRLVASDDSTGERAGAGGASAEELRQLENQLSVAEEDLDRARRNNNDLNTRLADLEGQIETLNEIVKLKDDQLAALRAEVQRLQSEQPATPAPQPAATPASGSLLSNPLVLGGLALIIVGLAAGAMIFMRRRRAAAEDDFEEEEFTAIADADEAIAADPDDQEPALSLEEEEEDVSPQTSDVISEAEIYIAYGRFPQAITFLQNAIESEPERADIQLKLLEVYVQTEDATAFNLQFDRLKALGDDDATAQALELQKQIPGAAESAEAAMDATVVSNEPVQAIEEPSDDDDDLSFDLDDLDAETEEDSLDLGDDVDLDDDASGDDDESDFDLDLDLAADSTEDDDSSDLDLDLDLDDEGDETTGSSDDDLDLGDDDLDLDLDLDETGSEDKSAKGDSDDDDLDLDLDLGDDDDDGAISLDDDDSLDLDAELEQAASSGGDDELSLDDDDDGFELNLDDDDDDPLDLSEAAAENNDTLELNTGGDDGFELDLDADDDTSVDDDAFELNLDDDDDDDGFELNLDDDGDSSDDDGLELNLDEADDDDGFSLDLDDDDGELNLDEDAGTKLDLARAYIEMDNKDDARPLLEEVARDGDESEKQQANELLEQI